MAVSYAAVASLLTAFSSLEKLSLPPDCSIRLKRRVLPSLKDQALSTRLGVAPGRCGFAVACLPSTTESEPIDPTKLYISGLSFRTSKDGLIDAFKNYGQLVEVNLVMDRIAKRSRGFAFLRYSNEEESRKAIEGMHGKFLDGRVIFVEVCKPRSTVPRQPKRSPLQY
ncbi:organelle RRM domain-containing protein 6, chloroplastic-like [Carex rostrata]